MTIGDAIKKFGIFLETGPARLITFITLACTIVSLSCTLIFDRSLIGGISASNERR